MKKFLLFALCATIIFSFSLPTYANNEQADFKEKDLGQILEIETFDNLQDTSLEEYIEDIAIGETITNDDKTFRITKTVENLSIGDLETTTITQLNQKESYENGSKEYYTQNTISTLSIDTGQIPVIRNDPSNTIEGRVTCNYEVTSNDGVVIYKRISRIWRKATSLDTSFRCTKITGEAVQHGSGWHVNNNNAFVGIYNMPFPTVNYPSSGVAYEQNGIPIFVNVNGGGSGSADAYFYFQRNTGGTVYNFRVVNNVF